MESEKLKSFVLQNAPCYVYHKKTIVDKCCRLQEAMPNVTFLYSVKSNPFQDVIDTIAANGFGADAASAKEVVLASKSGITSDRVLYSAPGKTESDIAQAWGMCIFIADSFHELELLNTKAESDNKQVEVGIRVNPAFSMYNDTCVSSKFGIDENTLMSTLDSFMQHLPFVKVVGIHMHIQSQVLDTNSLVSYYEKCFQLALRMNAIPCVEIKFINFGSGIGTVYHEAIDQPVDLNLLSVVMKKLESLNRDSLNASFYIETGRFVVCNSGTYYTRIVDRKESNGKIYVIVQNAMNGFLRPVIAALLHQNLGRYPENGQEPLYTSEHEFDIHVLNNETQKTEIVDVVGNLCTSIDVFARNVLLPKSQIGDILAISNAGSYGFTLSPSRFSSANEPGEYLWED